MPRRKASVRRRMQALKKTTNPELRAIFDEVNPNTTELFGKINDFLTNKMGIEALRAEIVPPGVLEAEEVNVFSGFSLADLQAGDGVFNADLGCGGSDRESRLTSSEPAQREAAPSGVAPSEAGSQDVGV